MNCPGPVTWTTRAAPSVMSAIDARITRRGPSRSTSAPMAGWVAAFTRRLAEAASASVERPSPSSPRIGLKRIPNVKLTPVPTNRTTKPAASAPIWARRTRSPGGEDEAGSDGVGVELAGGVRQAGLGGHQAAADVDHPALRAQPPGGGHDRPHEVHLQLGGRVSGAGRQHRVDRAGQRGVEERADDAAVN